MSSGRDGADERFAAAWDERMRGRASDRPARPTDGTAPFAAPAPRSGPADPDLERDLRIADALRRTGRAVGSPDAGTSARMRASVMDAVRAEAASAGPAPSTRRLERPVADRRGTPGHGRRRAERRGGTRPDTSRADGSRPAARRRGPLHRLLSTTAAGMACILALGALTVLLSRGTLPGETLYGLKRASESAELALTSGQEATARKHLDLAALRLDEVDRMVQRTASSAAGAGPVAAGLSEADAVLVADNLRAFDQQARTGARMLFTVAARPSGPSAGVLTGWVTEQRTVLEQFAPSLSGSGREQAAQAQDLLDRLGTRAAQFSDDDPSCTGSSSDEFGPVPCPDDTPAPAAEPTPETTEATTAESSSSTSPTTTTTTSSGTTTSATGTTTTDEQEPTSTAPPAISVPVPVPGLPKVEVPPLLPGLPGLSLG